MPVCLFFILGGWVRGVVLLWLSLVSVVAVYMAGMGWGSSVGLHAERGSRARGAWRRGCLVLTGVAASRRTLRSAFPRLTRSLTWMVDTEASLCRRGGACASKDGELPFQASRGPSQARVACAGLDLPG